MVKSGEKGEKWGKVIKSGEKWGKVIKSGEKWEKWESGEKWRKVGKSGKKVSKSVEKWLGVAICGFIKVVLCG